MLSTSATSASWRNLGVASMTSTLPLEADGCDCLTRVACGWHRRKDTCDDAHYSAPGERAGQGAAPPTTGLAQSTSPPGTAARRRVGRHRRPADGGGR